MEVLLCVLIIFNQLLVSTTIQGHLNKDSEQPKGSAQQKLNILLMTLPESGNLAPLLSLGGELVLRGHNVMLLTTNREEGNFANRTMMQADKAGVEYKTAGNSVFNLNEIGKNPDKSLLKILSLFAKIMPQEQGILMESFAKYLDHNQVDAVICAELLQPVMACINSAYQVPVIALGTALQYQIHTYPVWPWPGVLSGFSSDDLTFGQRFKSTLAYHIGHFMFQHVMIRTVMSSIQHYCPDAGLSYASSAVGIYLPHIVQSVIGFEYPRTISPLTSYVGPILSKSPDPISSDLLQWLDVKGNGEVIYISMGSFLVLTREEIMTILNGILATQYSAVWALRTKTEDDLVGVDIDPDRFYITKWAPQLSVLGHRSIGMALLHGGSNGLHEALYNEIPPIVLPMAGDQYANAGRVHYHNLGIHISTSNLTTASLTDAIRRIDGGNYRSNVANLKRRFVAAGGVERAAELVELYAAVGYDNLIPAYAKYNWSGIQYHNIDVYVIIAILVLAFSSFIIGCFFCTFRKLCHAVSKKKAD